MDELLLAAAACCRRGDPDAGSISQVASVAFGPGREASGASSAPGIGHLAVARASLHSVLARLATAAERGDDIADAVDSIVRAAPGALHDGSRVDFLWDATLALADGLARREAAGGRLPAMLARCGDAMRRNLSVRDSMDEDMRRDWAADPGPGILATAAVRLPGRTSVIRSVRSKFEEDDR